ncbi:MAG TPA: hypothetical protein VKU02_24090 [Gemmataceae bacterium]|nr:hypothetical protein [Gemmataceae bacterium]
MAHESESLTAWQRAWRYGIAPSLSAKGLLALQQALERGDPALIQGATIVPPPLQAVQNWSVEAACAIGYAGWRGEGLNTVAQVEAFFAHVCFEADQELGEPAAASYFLNAYDTWTRSEMRRLLLPEVNLALAQRGGQQDDVLCT